VLANQASVTKRLEPAWLALAHVAGRPVRIFAPEHGVWGTAQDMEAVDLTRETTLDVPVVSLYGSGPETLAPRAADLSDLDVVIVDLPDIGCRYYTFAATMAYLMAGCARAGVEVVVCDRPNPIGGVATEGGPVLEGCASFVSELPVPVRHGLTLGELALLVQASRYPALGLTVKLCQGWRRSSWWDDTGLPWVAPSPNMPTLNTAAVYPGACLVEATNLSEGRGTTRPFQLIGAPWIDGEALAARLNALALPGCAFRATRFRPEFGKHSGRVCGGIEWHVTDRASHQPVAAGVHVLIEARRADPAQFGWREEAYEFVADVPAIDLLSGSSEARRAIDGGLDPGELFADWRRNCVAFEDARSRFRLYHEI
jgi:uncharacterized protein YbbC (DUF1343 family)